VVEDRGVVVEERKLTIEEQKRKRIIRDFLDTQILQNEIKRLALSDKVNPEVLKYFLRFYFSLKDKVNEGKTHF